MGQKNAKLAMPGVIYSEDWIAPHEEDYSSWKGTLFHVRPEHLPSFATKVAAVDDPAKKPGPEEVPYTFWERIGAVPVNVARLRPRQYYYPVTDFSKYTYDEVSPEEAELKARWLARMWDFGWQYPMLLWSVGSAMCIPLPFRARLPATVAVGITVVMMEFHRVYVNSAQEKEQLDDFIMAKEVWYIKNVETKEFGLETLPPGMTGIQAVQQRWLEEERSMEDDAQMTRHGMLSSTPIAQPQFKGPREDAAGRQLGPPDGGVYMGDIGTERPGKQQPQRGLMRFKEGTRVPSLPL